MRIEKKENAKTIFGSLKPTNLDYLCGLNAKAFFKKDTN